MLQVYDEQQLGKDVKTGYAQLLEAQKLNQDILIKVHKHRKETIKLQLTKMHKFKQFMDIETFDQQTRTAMGTHMKKIEVLSVLRALASKYAERNDFQKGLSYIERAEKLSKDLL